MSLSTQPYKGTRDFFPAEMRFRKWMFDQLRKSVERFGFEEYDGPLLESFDLYAAKSGEEIVDQQLYSFTDRGDRRVAIRPEMTPTLARLVASRFHEIPKPIRWYSLPNLWRYERPQRGRLREHWQLNVDILGGEALWADAEILQVALALMSNFGATDSFAIHVNNRKLMNFVFREKLGLDTRVAQFVARIVDSRPKIGEEVYVKSLRDAGLSDQVVAQLETFFSTSIVDLPHSYPCEGSRELVSLFELLNVKSDHKQILFDPKIVRGLDYYTGTVFEMYDTSPDNTRAMFGGGRYDNLVGLFGKDQLSGVGFGMGDVTLENYVKAHDRSPPPTSCSDVFVAILDPSFVAKANEVAANLRAQGLRTMTSLQVGKIGALIKNCEKHGVRFFLLFGESEISNRVLAVKDLKTGEQQSFPENNFAAIAAWTREAK